MITPNAVLEHLLTRLRADPQISTIFRDVSRREFPFCDDWPAIHVNASDTRDDTSILGFGFRARTIRVQVFITLQRQALETLQPDLWDTVDLVRSVIQSDRDFIENGEPLLVQPVIRVDVSSVSSPIGTAYLGTRRLEFDAVIRETLYS